MKYIRLIICVLALLVLTSCSDKTKNNKTAANAEHTGKTAAQAVSDAFADKEPAVRPQPSAAPAQDAAAAKETVCTVHDPAWHTYSSQDILRCEQFRKWTADNAQKSTSGDCPNGTNLYRFIRQYGITRGEFEQEYYGSRLYYFEDHNVDLLFGADEAKAEAYYRTDSADYQARQDRREKLSAFGVFKLSLMEQAESNEKWQDFYNNTVLADKETLASPTAWSIADFVRETGITQKELESRVNDYYLEKGVEPFAFNYSLLYSTLVKHPFGDTPVDKINEDNAFCSLDERVSTKVWLK